MRKLILAFILALFMAGCSTPVTSGTIADMKIDQVADYDKKCKTVPKKVTTTKTVNGQQKKVTETKQVKECKQVFDEMEDVHRLQLRDAEGKTGWVDVTPEVYNSVQVGQQYPR